MRRLEMKRNEEVYQVIYFDKAFLEDSVALKSLKNQYKFEEVVLQPENRWMVFLSFQTPLWFDADWFGAEGYTLLFESIDDAYCTICRPGFCDLIIDIAVLDGSEAAFSLIKLLVNDKHQDQMTLNVINVFDLMGVGQFVKYQDCRSLKKPDQRSLILMVSHRWETKDSPDPDRIQFHGVIRFIIRICMMAMRSTPNVFNSVDFSEVSLCPELFKRLVILYQKYVSKFQPKSEIYDILDKHLFHRSQQLARYLMQTIGEQNTIIVANDIGPLAYMMDYFYIWYDYTSLPQAPRTNKEQFYFDQELDKLNQYFSEYYTVIIWSKNSLKRAWCFLEAIISNSSQKQSIFSSENSLVSSTEPAPINQLFFTTWSVTDQEGNLLIDLGEINDDIRQIKQRQDTIESEILRTFGRNKGKVDLTRDLTLALNTMIHEASFELKGKSKADVLSYLTEHKYKCTNGADIESIAEKLSAQYNVQ